MGKTITEKILARAASKDEVYPGEIIWADLDALFTHETVGPRVFAKSFEELGGKVWDQEKFSVYIDHYNLPSTLRHAEIVKFTLDWCKSHNIKYLYTFCGPEHQVLIEEGFIQPGTVVVGTDSHTTTAGALGSFATGIGSTDCAFALATGKLWFRVPPSYRLHWDGSLENGVMAKDMALKMIGTVNHGGATYKSCEFIGPLIRELSIDGRIVLSNMAVEMGAKNGIINPDKKTIEYINKKTKKSYKPVTSDEDAEYEKEFYFEGNNLEPLVATPHNVDNVKPVSDAEGINIDSVLIGTCTGGRLEDMIAAASILRGRKIKQDVSAIIMPASMKIYREMLNNKLIEIFIDSGCIVTYPTCGPCAGHLGGLLAPDEVRISAQNRNFQGRSGSNDSQIYLASPITCAAAALEGQITDPRNYL
jgi:3-isopropylmalate/(R)-2-methylmalate dehydratase large subunit